ncbi:hypothetical protein [Sinomonas sp. G460-2]|uniref:hypothetical protein n=1 Tax=Sinomonas sp. G460-2 TaxID=3393464 RepID=UPI0039EEF4FF
MAARYSEEKLEEVCDVLLRRFEQDEARAARLPDYYRWHFLMRFAEDLASAGGWSLVTAWRYIAAGDYPKARAQICGTAVGIAGRES